MDKQLNLHFKNGKKELKIDIKGLESADELRIIADLVKSLNINMQNHTNFLEEDKVENCSPTSLKKLEEGYQVLVQAPEPPVVSKNETKDYTRFFNAASKDETLAIQKYVTEYNTRLYNDGIRYQTYYICPKCKKRGKRYITPDTNKVYCHDCDKSMNVHPAHEDGFPKVDEFDNFFVAGDYVKPTT